MLAFIGALALVGCLTVVRTEASTAEGSTDRGSLPRRSVVDRNVAMPFDIPAQRLQDALDEFGTLTGISGFYGADAITGHRSAAIRGRYTPDAVLRMLIEGTGLVVYYTAPDAFVLEQVPLHDLDEASRARERGYDALVQARVREIFCRNPQIAPADYRVAVSFRIDAAGRIVRPLALDSTGDAARDREILSALQQVDIGHPPADASRDFVMLILPRALSDGSDCASH